MSKVYLTYLERDTILQYSYKATNLAITVKFDTRLTLLIDQYIIEMDRLKKKRDFCLKK